MSELCSRPYCPVGDRAQHERRKRDDTGRAVQNTTMAVILSRRTDSGAVATSGASITVNSRVDVRAAWFAVSLGLVQGGLRAALVREGSVECRVEPLDLQLLCDRRSCSVRQWREPCEVLVQALLGALNLLGRVVQRCRSRTRRPPRLSAAAIPAR